MENIVVAIANSFVGEGWHLTLGVLFMLVVIFLPGGIVEGIEKTSAYLRRKFGKHDPAELQEISEGERA